MYSFMYNLNLLSLAPSLINTETGEHEGEISKSISNSHLRVGGSTPWTLRFSLDTS